MYKRLKIFILFFIVLSILTCLFACSGSSNSKVLLPKINSNDKIFDSSQPETLNKVEYISEEDAKKVAAKAAGAMYNTFVFDNINLTIEDEALYSVRFHNNEAYFNCLVNALSGEVVNLTEEPIETAVVTENEVSETQESNYIGENKAKKIVLDKIRGASEDDVTISLNTDNEKPLYEGTVPYERIEYKFSIDAQTGKIVNWETSPLY